MEQEGHLCFLVIPKFIGVAPNRSHLHVLWLARSLIGVLASVELVLKDDLPLDLHQLGRVPDHESRLASHSFLPKEMRQVVIALEKGVGEALFFCLEVSCHKALSFDAL